MDETSVYFFKLYYFPLVAPLAMLWLWGVNVRHWTELRVNYVSVFNGEEQRMLLAHNEIYEMAAYVTACAAVSASFFALASLGGHNSFAAFQPMLLYCGLVGLLILPVDVFYLKNREFFLKTLGRIAWPFQTVNFADFLLADMLTSLSKPLADLETATCHIVTSNWLTTPTTGPCTPSSWIIPVVLALPYLWRLLQCVRVYQDTREVPNLYNACKYFSAFPVIFLSAYKYHIEMAEWEATYKPAWLVCAAVNTLFLYYWDITRDWEFGLFSRGYLWGSGGQLLRDNLIYGNRIAYVWAIASNFFLRIAWTHKLSHHLKSLPLTVVVISTLEVFRRFQWTYIRIEVQLLKDARKAAGGGAPLEDAKPLPQEQHMA